MKCLKLTIEKGPAVGKECTVIPGQTLIVGRVDQAGWILRDDPMLSNLHFAIEWHGDKCMLTDHQSKFGTKLNGEIVRVATPLKDGDVVNAGQTLFRVRMLGADPEEVKAVSVAAVLEKPQTVLAAAVSGPSLSSPAANALAVLRRQMEPLFAILDAAREPPVVYDLILHCGQECQSLYEGQRGEALAPFAPHLLSLPAPSEFLTTLVTSGWGKSWGIFLTATQSFKEVRRHFRHFLEVELPDKKRAYFRFYDPRVLRTYLPTCTAEERNQFFGPVSRFFLEGKELQILPFASDDR